MEVMRYPNLSSNYRQFPMTLASSSKSIRLDSNRRTLQLHLLGHIRTQPDAPVLLGRRRRRLGRQHVRRLDVLRVRHAPRLRRGPVRRVPGGRAVGRRLQDDEARLDALALRAARPRGLVAERAVRHVVEVVPELALGRVRVRLREEDELVWGLVAEPVPFVLWAVSDVGQFTIFGVSVRNGLSMSCT